MLRNKQDTLCKMEKLYIEVTRSLENFPKSVGALMKNTHHEDVENLEDLKRQSSVLRDVAGALQQVKHKNVASAKKERELAERYVTEYQEDEQDLQRERDIFNQAVLSHEAVKQGLLKQIESKKAQYVQLQKELIIAQSQTVSACTDDSLLSLQERLATADAQYKDLQLKVTNTRAKYEQQLKVIEAMVEEKMKDLMGHIKTLQEMTKPK